MSPDSLTVEVLAVAAAVIAAIATGLAWDRRPRHLPRIVALATCVATAAAAGLIWVNRQVDVYTSWSALVGGSATADTPVTAGAHQGRIVSFTVHGTVTLPVFAYLPAAYATHPATRFPVVEALHGYPGTPNSWLSMLDVVPTLDREIAAGRMAPTVVLFPYQTPDPLLDTECTNLVNGPKMETFLTVDVPAAARKQLRLRADRAGWGLIGYSAGGYCASDLLLRHPGEYAAAASLSGYANPGIRIGDGTEHTLYDDAWRLRHLPIPAAALYLTCARSDATALRGTIALAHLAKSPLSVTTAFINGGGHDAQTWQAMEAPAFDWLSTWLGRPA